MKKKHQGGCHCGAVRYEAELDLGEPVFECNCSHCQVKGFLLKFTPEFALLSGEDMLTEYRFNTKKIAHLFCKKCGVQAFGKGEKDGASTYAVNVRSIDGIDPSTLTIQKIYGKDI